MTNCEMHTILCTKSDGMLATDVNTHIRVTDLYKTAPRLAYNEPTWPGCNNMISSKQIFLSQHSIKANINNIKKNRAAQVIVN